MAAVVFLPIAKHPITLTAVAELTPFGITAPNANGIGNKAPSQTTHGVRSATCDAGHTRNLQKRV